MAAARNPYEVLPEADQRLLIDIHFRARVALEEALDRHGAEPGLGDALARAWVAFLDHELVPVTEAMARAGTPVDCRRGCCSCCTLMVEVTPDEVFALVDRLEARLDPAELAATRDRAVEIDRRGRTLPAEQRHLLRLFCPVLDRASGDCRAHEVRPIACQGYLSLDHRRCEADSAGTPTPILKPVASDLIRDAVMSARTILLEDAGYDQTRIELSAGLVAAWADPAAERRWLAGGRAFP
jgi:Fe-S-cluster containining protein